MNGMTIPLKEGIFWAALAVYLFVLPIAGTIGVRYLAFVVLIGVTVAVLIETRGIPPLPFAGYWLAYFLVALVSVFFAVAPAVSLSELRVEVIYCMVIFVIGVTWGGRALGLEPFAILLAVINGALTASAFYFASLDMPLSEVMRIPGFARAGMDGNWLLVTVFLNSWLGWRLWNSGHRAAPILLTVLVVLDVWAMLASHNRQNLVALGAGIATAAVLLLHTRFSWRRAAFFLGLLIVVAALLVTQMQRRSDPGIAPPPDSLSVATAVDRAGDIVGTATTSDVRWKLWKFSLQKIMENPWTGGGIGRTVFDKLYPEFMPENPQLWHAHNMILNRGIQMGIPGMIVFAALWMALAVEVLRYARSPSSSRYLAIAGLAAIVAIFAKNLTDDFFVRNSALFFWLFTGYLIGCLRTGPVRVSTGEP
jgi:O-antigen ligase